MLWSTVIGAVLVLGKLYWALWSEHRCCGQWVGGGGGGVENVRGIPETKTVNMQFCSDGYTTREHP